MGLLVHLIVLEKELLILLLKQLFQKLQLGKCNETKAEYHYPDSFPNRT